MEVVGVVAAIPGLVEIVSQTIAITKNLVRHKVLAREVAELEGQLEDVENILKDVQRRSKSLSLSQSQLRRLSPIFDKLRHDLTDLRQLLEFGNSKHSAIRLIKHAKLVVTRVDKSLKAHKEELGRAQASLTLLLVDQIQINAEDNASISRAKLRLQLHDTLNPCGTSFIPRKFDHTCEWIWSNHTFTRWATTPLENLSGYAQRILCVYGPKECGKSVLTASIAERWKSQGKATVFFSFWFGSDIQQKLVGFFRTILWQLLHHVEDSELPQICHQLLSDSTNKEHDMQMAIKKAIGLIKTDIHLVIDGIDESADDWNDLRSVGLQFCLHCVQDHSNVRVLLSGREPSMRCILGMDTLKLEITETLIKDDIRTVITNELDSSTNLQDPSLRKLVHESLQSNSHLMFLWVRLIFKELNRCCSINEVKHTLNHVPHDLDREYHRLFARLMRRSGGGCARPSIVMKRAKRLLSLIIAAPEPLNLQELRYAHAAEEKSDLPYDDDLITREGIIDACGDLIRESDGLVHIVHASIVEFLCRPLDQWKTQDEDIIFFRIERLGAKQSMCLACFNYLGSIDLGYPLTDSDNPLSTLPSKYPFLSHSGKFLPHYLMDTIGTNGTPSTEISFVSFTESTQFCALVEYLVLNIEADSWDLAFYYLPFLFGFDLGDTLLNIPTVFEKELNRRDAMFGQAHLRYTSWRDLSAIITLLGIDSSALTSPSAVPEQSDTTVNELKAGIPPRLDSGPFQAISEHLIASHRRNLVEKACVGFSSLSPQRLLQESLRKLPMLLSNAVPTSVLLLWITYILQPSITTQSAAQAKPLIQLTYGRVKHQRNFYEALCLLYLALVEPGCTESAENFCRGSLEIAESLPVFPHIELVRQESQAYLVYVLFSRGKNDEAEWLSRDIEERIRNNLVAKSSASWLRHVAYHRRWWATSSREILHAHAETSALEYMGFEDVLRITGYSLDAPQVSDLEKAKISSIRAYSLYREERYDEAECAFQLGLSILDKVSQHKTATIELRVDIMLGLGWCLLRKYKIPELIPWLIRIEDQLDHLGWKVESWFMSNLAELLASGGEYDRAITIYQRVGKLQQAVLNTADYPTSETFKYLAEALNIVPSENRMVLKALKCLSWDALVCGINEDDDFETLVTMARVSYSFRHESPTSKAVWELLYMHCIDRSIGIWGFRETEYLYDELIRCYKDDGNEEASAAVDNGAYFALNEETDSAIDGETDDTSDEETDDMADEEDSNAVLQQS